MMWALVSVSAVVLGIIAGQVADRIPPTRRRRELLERGYARGYADAMRARHNRVGGGLP